MIKKFQKNDILEFKVAIQNIVIFDEKNENPTPVKLALLKNDKTLAIPIKDICDFILKKMDSFIKEYIEIIKPYKQQAVGLTLNYWKIISFAIPYMQLNTEKQAFFDKVDTLKLKYKDVIEEIEEYLKEEIEVDIETLTIDDLAQIKYTTYDQLEILRRYVIAD
jgi:hypothetical protein